MNVAHPINKLGRHKERFAKREIERAKIISKLSFCVVCNINVCNIQSTQLFCTFMYFHCFIAATKKVLIIYGAAFSRSYKTLNRHRRL